MPVDNKREKVIMPNRRVRVWRAFREINLFESDSIDEEVVEREKYSTSIYLICIFILLLISGFVTLSISRLEYINESFPSQIRFERLSQVYSSTLDCPCSKISISYQAFATVRMIFHQVCSSEFISKQWIKSINIHTGNHSTLAIGKDDLRSTLSAFWQIIGAFCGVTDQLGMDAVKLFNATNLFSPIAMDKEKLRIQSVVAFETILSNLQSNMDRSLLAIERITAGNQFVTALGSNFDTYLASNYAVLFPRVSARVFGNCSCLNINGCSRQSTISSSEDHSEIVIPSIKSDCLMVDAVLKSTLQCYYNLTCIELLHPAIDSLQPLKTDADKRFTLNFTISNLLDHLMIDEIFIDVDFSRFYAQCQPTYCSYSYSHRFDLIFTITTLIGLYGGFSILVGFVSPMMAKYIIRRKKRNLPDQAGNTTSIPTQRTSLSARLRTVKQSLFKMLVSLNLFKSRFPEPEKISRQIITTRIFIMLLTLTCTMIGCYLILSTHTQVIIIDNPSLDTYERLASDHGGSLACPCATLSIPFGNFLNISYTLHQICSSDLVSSDWLEFILLYDPNLITNDGSISHEFDFRTVGSAYFQLVATLCIVAKETIDKALTTLLINQFVSDRVPAKSMFLEQMRSVNDSFVNLVLSDFLRTKNWLYTSAEANQFVTAQMSNVQMTLGADNFSISLGDSVLGLYSTVTETSIGLIGACSCRRRGYDCESVSILFYKSNNGSELSQYFVGMLPGCMPLFSVLRSSINWWYNDVYIRRIQDSFAEGVTSRISPSLHAMNSSEPSRFLQNGGTDVKLETLLNAVFIELWTGNISRFDLFYQQCRPRSCSYTTNDQYSIIRALLLLISICGGLNKGLRLLLPIGVKLCYNVVNKYRHRHRHQNIGEYIFCKNPALHQVRSQFDMILFLEVAISVGARIQHQLMKVRHSLLTMNLYKSRETSETILHNQLVNTRIYLTLLGSSIMVVLIYTGFERRSEILTIPAPLDSVGYDELNVLHGNTLHCPCTQLSIRYNRFFTKMQVESFHPVCSSDFSSDKWIGYLITWNDPPYWTPDNDFRQWGAPFFRALRSLCSIAGQSVNYSLSHFLSSNLIADSIISRNQFENQINAALDYLERTIADEFMQTLQLIRTTSQGNGLINVFSSNWYFTLNRNDPAVSLLDTRPVTYENATCSCATSTLCSSPAVLFYQNSSILYTIEGIRFGCTILESLLQSSLECFYSSECLSMLLTKMPEGGSSSHLQYIIPDAYFSPLRMNRSRFLENDSIEMITNRLFIDSWAYNFSYELFFQSCAAQQCSFVHVYRFDPVIVLTTFLSVFSGLTLGLHFVVPWITKIVKKLTLRFSVVPQ